MIFGEFARESPFVDIEIYVSFSSVVLKELENSLHISISVRTKRVVVLYKFILDNNNDESPMCVINIDWNEQFFLVVVIRKY